MTDNELNGEEEKIYRCQVCNDDSSGRHYGAFTCEGCKGFFRRIICFGHQNHYGCIGQGLKGQCEISVDGDNRRKCCKSCRFRKCLDIGMKPELCVKIDKQVDRNGNNYGLNDHPFYTEEQLDLFREAIQKSFTQTMDMNDMNDSSLANKQFYIVLNQLRLHLESKVRRFVSLIDEFRELDVIIQCKLFADALNEVLVLMIVSNFDRYQMFVRQNNLYFGDQEMDTTFRALISLFISMGGSMSMTDDICSHLWISPAIYLLAIVDSHRVDTEQRPCVQKLKDKILEAFQMTDELKAVKVSQVLHFLKQMNCLFIKAKIF